MSAHHSITDALINWHEMQEEHKILAPTPLSREKRDELKSISSYLEVDAMAICLSGTMKTLWSAVENKDNPPSTSEMQHSLWQCHEVAMLIARAAHAKDDVNFRLNLADKYEALHGGRQP